MTDFEKRWCPQVSIEEIAGQMLLVCENGPLAEPVDMTSGALLRDAVNSYELGQAAIETLKEVVNSTTYWHACQLCDGADGKHTDTCKVGKFIRQYRKQAKQ